VLEVLGEAPVAPEPGKGALDYPKAWQDDEALHIVAPLVDRQAQPRHLCHGSVNLPGVVAAIGPDAPSRSWIAAEWTTTRIGSPSLSTGGVDFGALDLLAGVVTDLLVITALFC
jgi:hypothetical protein